MFRISLLLIALSISFSQWGARASVAFSDPGITMIIPGVQYKIVDDKKMPINLIAQYGFGSGDGSIDYTALEIGGNIHYNVADKINLVGTLVYTSLTTKIPIVTFGSVDITSSDLTIIVGAAYMINDQLSIEAGYGFSGLDGLRAGATFSF